MMLGAVLGIYTSINYLIEAQQYPQFEWAGYVFGALFLLLGWSGLFLLQTGAYSRLTLLLQVIQVVGFAMLGYKYQFCAGSSLTAGLNIELKQVYYTLKPIDIDFTLGKNIRSTYFHLNLVPMVVIGVLLQYYHRSGTKAP
jgi:hypothetical protein